MQSRRLPPLVSECTAVSEGPPFLAGVGGANGGAIGGFGVVSGPRSSSSLHCVHNACEIMFAASEMASPLVSEGAVVLEGQYTTSGGFGVISGPHPALFLHCVRNAWPLVLEGAVVSEGAVDALRMQCLAPGFGGGCGFGSVDVNTDEMSVFVTWCWCSCYTASSAA